MTGVAIVLIVIGLLFVFFVALPFVGAWMERRTGHTPVIETSSDVHLTNLDDNYWRIDVVTHIFADDVEVAQGMVSHITKNSEHDVSR